MKHKIVRGKNLVCDQLLISEAAGIISMAWPLLSNLHTKF